MQVYDYAKEQLRCCICIVLVGLFCQVVFIVVTLILERQLLQTFVDSGTSAAGNSEVDSFYGRFPLATEADVVSFETELHDARVKGHMVILF